MESKVLFMFIATFLGLLFSSLVKAVLEYLNVIFKGCAKKYFSSVLKQNFTFWIYTYYFCTIIGLRNKL